MVWDGRFWVPKRRTKYVCAWIEMGVCVCVCNDGGGGATDLLLTVRGEKKHKTGSSQGCETVMFGKWDGKGFQIS